MMAAPANNESSSHQYEQYGPFGDWGDHVGQCAIVVLDGLSKPMQDTFRPSGRLVVLGEDDPETLEGLADLESGVRFIEPHPEIDGSEIGDLHRAFARFHTALPLSEAERYWLFDPVDRERPKLADIHQPETLLGVTEEVTSAGVKQVIQGREIVRRLAAWRREADEFADQGTLDEAREALGTIATTLVIDANWPREHKDLRVQLRQAQEGG